MSDVLEGFGPICSSMQTFGEGIEKDVTPVEDDEKLREMIRVVCWLPIQVQ